jgi:ribulose kinase
MQDQCAGGPEGRRPPLDDPDLTAVIMGLQGQATARRPAEELLET